MISNLNDEIDNNISLKDFINDLQDWYQYLLSKIKIILFLSLLGIFFGIIYSWLDQPVYKAKLTFAMEEDKGGSGSLGGALGLASSFGIDLGGAGGGGAFAASNLSDLMKSRLIVEKVLLNSITIDGKETSLAEYYIEINKLRDKWSNNKNLKNISFLPNSDRNSYTRQQDSILNQIYKNLIDKDNLSILQKDKKVSILTLEVNNKNEIFSKFFCENLAKETSNFYVETKSKKAKSNVDVLQKQVDSVKSELKSAISGVALEADNVYNLNPALNQKGSASKKRQIDVQSNTAILTNLVVQLELAKITLRKETPLIQMIDVPIFPLEISKFGKLSSILLCGFLSAFLTILFFVIKRRINNLLQ